MRGLCAVAAAAAWVTVSSLAGTAAAEPTAQDRAASEVLFNEALALAEKGEMPAACTKFEESQKLDPQLGTLLYLATCHEQTGRTATAFIEFTDALRAAEKAQKQERIDQAKQGVERTQAALARLTVRVTSPVPGQVVRVAGREVKVFDSALPYDPGELTIEAEAPQHETYRGTVTLPAGPTEMETVVPALAKKADAPPPATASGGSALPWIVGGAGVGVTAVGLVFGAVAAGESSSADDFCDGTVCTQEGLDGHDAANGWAWASNITVGVGLAAVGVGVFLLLTEDDAPPPVSVGAMVLPDGSFAASVGGAF